MHITLALKFQSNPIQCLEFGSFGEGWGNTFSLFRYAVVILLKLRPSHSMGMDRYACVEAIS